MKFRKSNIKELNKYYDVAIECSLSSRVPEFTLDKDYVLKVISDLMHGEYFRVIEYKDEVVGWMAANKNNVQLYNTRDVLSVTSYQCILKGRKAIEALIDIHEDLYDFAISRKYELVVTNSVLNSRNTFNRILTQEGWLDRNSVLLRKTPHYLASSGGRRAVRPQTITEAMGR
jgi:hypothetical protein